MATQRTSPGSLGIVWLAFVAAAFVYAVVLVVVTSTPDAQPGTIPSPLVGVFVLLSVSQAGLAVWWRRRALSRIEVRQPGVAVAPLDAATAEQLATDCIVTWALAESIAIYGFVLGFLGRDLLNYVPFGLAAVALLYSFRHSAWTDRWPRT